MINKNINITEEDIFFYVFFPEKLAPQKRNYLTENEKFFAEQISFCKGFNEPDNLKIDELVDKKFGAILPPKIIELRPYQLTNEVEDIKYSLAANSGQNVIPKHNADAFSDVNSEYLLRIVEVNKKKTFSLFTQNNELVTNWKGTLYPSSKVITVKENKLEMEFPIENEIERIEIELI